MIQDAITRQDFVAAVEHEVKALADSVKEEYAGTIQLLSAQFAEQYFKYLSGTTQSDKERAELNIRHIKASLTHISAAVNLDVTDRIISVCEAILTIAISAAIRAII